MLSLKQRSDQKELLDEKAIPFDAIRQNMLELNTINTLLGGHQITQAGFLALAKNSLLHEVINVVEIGCGGGDNLRAIKAISDKKKINIHLTGIDINPECIAFARGQGANNGMNFICSDYKDVQFEQQPHIIFSSLFCHHFSNNELEAMLQWQYYNCKTGFFINDLHRHPFAYYSIKWLTALFSKSYMVKNDAPVSVQRSFIKEDWNCLLHKAGITTYHVYWKWAFRWLIVVTK